MSGVRTGLTFILAGVSSTRTGLLQARTACSAAGTGPTSPGTAGQRTAATTTSRSSGTTPSVSGLFLPQTGERTGERSQPSTLNPQLLHWPRATLEPVFCKNLKWEAPLKTSRTQSQNGRKQSQLF